MQTIRIGSRGTTKAVSARTVPSAVITSHCPRSTRTTRPGTSPWAAYEEKAAAQSSSQPYGVSEDAEEEKEEREEDEKDKGNPSQGGPGTRARRG
ncbi:hypothetical protein GCM10010231_17840 [Streptomyces sindenensis]|nr:hypothetical protein GCM10010231_17840 [Streptomyces sindenensis]